MNRAKELKTKLHFHLQITLNVTNDITIFFRVGVMFTGLFKSHIAEIYGH